MKQNMDCRLATVIRTETCNSVIELQDLVGALFPWRMYADNEVILNNDTIQIIIQRIKKANLNE